MGKSKKKKIPKIEPIKATWEGRPVGLFLITDEGQIIGTARPRPSYIKASRKVPRPSQWGTFTLHSISWGFMMKPKSASMKAGRVAVPYSGIITHALRQKALDSIGAPLQIPSLTWTNKEVILPM